MSQPRGARDVARRVLLRVEREGAWATLALDGELGRSGLPARDRRLAAELVYGVLRHRQRLDLALASYADLSRTPPLVVLALRIAAYQVLFLDRVPAHAAIDDAATLVWKKADAADAKAQLTGVRDALGSVDGAFGTIALLEAAIKEYIGTNGLQNGNVLWPLRVALSGAEKSASPYELLWALGKEESVARIDAAITKLA